MRLRYGYDIAIAVKLSGLALAQGENMDDQQIQDVIDYCTRPWSERRGIETTDRNAEVVLIRTPLDNLFNVLRTQSIEARQDVVGSEIEILGAFLFTYQLFEHSWSIMAAGCVPEYGCPPVVYSSQLAQLSKHLNQPVIRLLVSDTAISIGYDLFKNGELVEYFRWANGDATSDSIEYEIQPQQYIWFPSLEDIEDGYSSDEIEQTVYFWSTCRQVTTEQMKNSREFAFQLLLDYDAFDPALDDSYFLGGYSILRQGDRYRVQNSGITTVLGYDPHSGRSREITSVPDLVRVDYFRFGS